MTDDPRAALEALVKKWREVDADDAKARGYLETWNTYHMCAHDVAAALASSEPRGVKPSSYKTWMGISENIIVTPEETKEIMREGVLPKSIAETSVPRPPSESQPTKRLCDCYQHVWLVAKYGDEPTGEQFCTCGSQTWDARKEPLIRGYAIAHPIESAVSRHPSERPTKIVGCQNGAHTWTSDREWDPERGTPCDCGMKQWGVPLVFQFDITNHHNALTCPLCNPKGLVLAPSSAEAVPPPQKICGQPAPDRSSRSCDKPQGHAGDHWTFGGDTKTWAAEAVPQPPAQQAEKDARMVSHAVIPPERATAPTVAPTAIWGCNACGVTAPWPSESGIHGGECRGDVIELDAERINASALRERVGRYLLNEKETSSKRLVRDLMAEVERLDQRRRELETANSEIAEANDAR